MSAHVKVYRQRHIVRPDPPRWVAKCIPTRCPGWGSGTSFHPTHAEALAAAWAHIKEHS